MVLSAINSDGKKVYSFRIGINKEDNFRCTTCNYKLIFVDGRVIAKHFRHKVESNCDPEPETERHIEMKQFMLDSLGWSDDCLEIPMGWAKPDLYKDGIAVEVQHSPITYEKFIERTSNYRKNNIYVLWVFDIELLKKAHDTNVSELLKKAHELYYGRVYFYVNKEIIPMHFKSSKRYINEYYNYSTGESFGGYEKFYRRRKEFVFGKSITDFILVRTYNDWKENDFLIARFIDKKFWKSEWDGKG